MLKFLFLVSAGLAVAAAGGAGDVDDALLARVANLLNNGGGVRYNGGDEGASSAYGVVDDSLLARVSQLIDGGSSSGGYPSTAYGAPTRSSGLRIGSPERAQKIAQFDLNTETRQFGGYGAPAPVPVPSYQYGADLRGSSRVNIGRPERAQQVAAFELGGGYTRTSGGYN